MARNWEIFLHGARPRNVDRMHVTINNRGSFCFNKKAYHTLGSPEAALFKYERDTHTIGIEPTHLQKQGAFPFRTVARGTNFMLYAGNFCQNHGIRVEGTEAFLDPQIDPDGTLALDLRTTRKVIGSKQRKRMKKRGSEE